MNDTVSPNLDTSVYERLARLLEDSPDHQMLRRLHIETSVDPHAEMFDDTRLLVVDVETTGVDPDACSIIELAARQVVVDCDGVIACIGEAFSWLEDPGAPLQPEIVALTGLTDADLAGKCLDDDAVRALFVDAELIVAHNAQFDRAFLDVRFPTLPLRPWVCSLADIDWRARGFDGRGLGTLLMQCGLFKPAGAHRAGADVEALIGVLGAGLRDQGTVAGALLAAARTPMLSIQTIGAHYDIRSALKARGYRWNATRSVWMKDVTIERREEELAWLAIHVYAPGLRAKATGPTVVAVEPTRRHSRDALV
jgi:DNA polymerase III subunit epsilon